MYCISKKNIETNENQSYVKQNGNKSKTSEDNIRKPVFIDLISTDGSDVSNSDYETTETEVEEQNEAEVTDEEELTEVEDEEYFDISNEEENSEPKKQPKLSATFCGSIVSHFGGNRKRNKKDNKNHLYSVQFNTYLPNGHNYFAAVGSNRVMVFECPKDGSIRLIDCYADTDGEKNKKKKTEDYYTCCWSFDEQSGNPLVIAGGYRGVIHIIDCGLKTFRHLCGHGGDINDLKVSPFDHNLLLSSSKDNSLRLWNLKTNVCIARFGGESGHRDQVICADFYLLSDKYFVSTGMDHSIKIWSLNKPDVRNAIKESYEYKDSDEKSFPMQCQHFPVFTNRKIHSNYVDCVQFFGKFLLSKSCDNEIVFTKPELLDNETGFAENRVNEDITQIGAFKLTKTSFWFIKFSMDFEQTLLSVGNNDGLTFVWDMAVDNPFEYEPLVLERKKCKSTIRQTSFSSDGTTLICVCDDSSIWRWNITRD